MSTLAACTHGSLGLPRQPSRELAKTHVFAFKPDTRHGVFAKRSSRWEFLQLV
jgi:hypothetical protein